MGLRSAAAALALCIATGAMAQSSEPAGDGEWIERTSRSGPVEARLRLRPSAPSIGDPLELELEVSAEAGVELLMPEFGEALGRFQIVDFAPTETMGEDDRTISVQRYTLAPERSGPQRVPPLRVEFVDHRAGHDPAPDGEDAYELLTEALDFEVASVLPGGAPLELRPAHGELAPRVEPGRALPWVAGAAVAAGLALAAFLALRALRARESVESPYAEARRALDSLLADGLPDPSDREALERYFVELSRIVRRYIERRFALRSPELTTEEFLGELRRSPDLLRSHQALLAEFLGTADLVKFARHTPAPEAVDHCRVAAARFLEATREAIDAPTPTGGDEQPAVEDDRVRVQ